VSKLYNVRTIGSRIFLITILLMTFILLDTLLIKFYDVMDKNIIPIMIKKIIFSVIVFVCVLLQLVVLRYLRRLNLKTQVVRRINVELINKIVNIAQCSLIIILGIIVFQVFYYNYYFSYLLMSVILISYLVSSIIIAKTMVSFISWYKLNRNIIFLLYSVSMSMILVNLILTTINVNLILSEKPVQIRQFAGGSMDISGGRYFFLSTLVRISSILSFASIWFTTALLMHTAKERFLKEVRYWVILSIPLGYFLFSYFIQDIFGSLLFPFIRSDPLLISLTLTSILILSKPVGGIIFGLLFWRISKLVKFDKTLRTYMVISGYGFLLLFSANQSTLLVLGPYPPFGLITITIMILATYFILIGIYTSATLISTNSELRKFIYNSAIKSNLLNLLGKAEMEKEIRKTVGRVIKYTSTSQEFDNANFDLDEKDLKKYLENVIAELKNNKDK
jgi:hypothetical protein